MEGKAGYGDGRFHFQRQADHPSIEGKAISRATQSRSERVEAARRGNRQTGNYTETLTGGARDDYMSLLD